MSGTVCPCCGSTTDSPALVDLNTNSFAVPGFVVRLSPHEAEVLWILARAYPAPARLAAVMSGLWGYNQPDTANTTVRVLVSRLRRKLAPLGIKIEAGIATGYRLKKTPNPLLDVLRRVVA